MPASRLARQPVTQYTQVHRHTLHGHVPTYRASLELVKARTGTKRAGVGGGVVSHMPASRLTRQPVTQYTQVHRHTLHGHVSMYRGSLRLFKARTGTKRAGGGGGGVSHMPASRLARQHVTQYAQVHRHTLHGHVPTYRALLELSKASTGTDGAGGDGGAVSHMPASRLARQPVTQYTQVHRHTLHGHVPTYRASLELVKARTGTKRAGVGGGVVSHMPASRLTRQPVTQYTQVHRHTLHGHVPTYRG